MLTKAITGKDQHVCAKMEEIRVVMERLQSDPRIKQLRDLVVLIAVLRFAGDIRLTLTELGLVGAVRALVLYPVLRIWAFAKKNIPFVRGQIQEKLGKNLQGIEDSMLKEQRNAHFTNFLTLPQGPMRPEQILEELKKYREIGHYHPEEGKVSGCVYNGGPDITKIATAASNLYEWTNPLHPDVFPGLRKIESESVSMVVNLFNAGIPTVVGSMTSGGTESILMAVRAHKEWAKDVKGITTPNIVAPVHAHPAFDKACEYFGIRINHVGYDPITYKVDLAAARRAITPNTIMLVGSCPSFPWGVIDDIEGLGKLAQEFGVGLHVDCCLGGFLVAFMEKAGFPMPKFDFRIPGVTSISCDTHKYGFTPKGTSVVMYRDADLRRYQYFSCVNWPGGIYASPTVAGSRPGQLVAGCWATLMYYGLEGYIGTTKTIIGHAREIVDGTKDIAGIQIIGNPQCSVVAYKSETVDIYRVAGMMAERGWNINNLQFPPSFHICCVLHTNAKLFISDLKEVMLEAMKQPGKAAEGSAAVYGLAASIPDRSLIADIARGYIDTLYKTVAD